MLRVAREKKINAQRSALKHYRATILLSEKKKCVYAAVKEEK
jgi:hypothetical protein